MKYEYILFLDTVTAYEVFEANARTKSTPSRLVHLEVHHDMHVRITRHFLPHLSMDGGHYELCFGVWWKFPKGSSWRVLIERRFFDFGCAWCSLGE